MSIPQICILSPYLGIPLVWEMLKKVLSIIKIRKLNII